MKTFNEVYETLPGTGWLTKPEAELLYRIASQAEGPILEVGCYHGRSTALLASLGRVMYCVDPFNDFDSDDHSGIKTKACFIENITTRGHTLLFGSNTRASAILDVPPFDPAIYLFQQKIEQWSPRYAGFAYLDGDHTLKGTLAQIDAALDVDVKSFCIHDYADSGGGLEVKKALDYRSIKVTERVDRMAYCRL